jgi:ATP-dependent Lhr-like helicase
VSAATDDPGLPAGFSAATREWFAGAFEAPTAAQAGAWEAIGAGDHALVVAPTGSGKTLAAFLWSLDRLLTAGPPADRQHRCRVLYVSPLKALATDVERNLRAPLVGIRQVAERHGTPLPEVAVGLRTGDTPQAQRRAFASRPPDVLITTPESLFLVLTSAARAGLAGVGTVIVDEIHAVAGTKRGAHLAVSLERLDALLEEHGGPAQRIGLSATVRPVDAVSGFLAGARTTADGGRPVRVVQPPAAKQVEVDVVVPVPDLSDLADAPATAGADGTAAPGPDLSGPAAGRPRRPSIWPHVEERVVDLVAAHRSTLVFANSRRGAERLTARMNEVWAGRTGADVPDPGSLVVAEAPAQSGTAVGAPTVLARAHHGSMSRAERTRTEDDLKAGRLPAVVATSSLELGIDMGSVDLVVQVGAPPSVASGLQRIGRAGHQVGAVSHGVMFPTFRGELVPAAVVAERMRSGAIEELHVPANPLDVLAQQVVAMVAVDDWDVDDLARVVRRAAPFTGLGDGALRAVLDMLAGRYPSEDFAELRPRLVWDRATGLLRGRPGALRLAATSGGTIPDRGLYGVFLAGSEREGTLAGGLRVGELDEEMVHESRVGDTFTLGSSTWRIEEITPDRVLVTPAPGLPGRLPFWKGDSLGRPLELGRAVGAWLREAAALPRDEAAARASAAGLDEWAADNLVAYLAEQREATGRVPDDTTVVVERFRDELGDWRVVVHSPFGARVHAPWALVIAGRLRERYGLDAAVMHSDDGIVLRLPDAVSSGEATWDTASASWAVPQAPQVDLADLLLAPDEVPDAVRAELGSSTIFAARFREAAGRALLLPRRHPDRRQPLWQQRQRSAQLLQVAAGHPEFPILLEAARECLQDDFDTAGLAALMADVAARRVQVVEVTTPTPSPFAQSLLFGYTAQFLYDGDAPLAERRAAALTLDPALLAELLAGDATPLADLLDPDAVLAVEAEVGGTAPDRLAADLEQVADVLRRHGPLDLAGARERTAPDARDALPGWLSTLVAQRRVLQVRCAGREQWAVVEDAARLRDALGVALPPGVPAELTAPVADPLGDLVRRHARTHGPFTAAQVARRFALPPAAVAEVLRRLETEGLLVVGRLRPEVLGGTGEDHCDVEVLRRIRRRSLAALRAEVEPVPAAALGRFLPEWQHVAGVETGPDTVRRVTGHVLRGVDGLARVVEQLAGYPVPASALETLVLPTRVVDYAPAMLDELTAAGEVLWAGHASLAARDGLVSLHPAATADLTLPMPLSPPDTPVHTAVRTALSAGGGWFLDPLVTRVAELTGEPPDRTGVVEALWDLAWCGVATNDGFGAVRARLGGTGRGTTHRTRASTPRGRALRPGLALRPSGGPSGPARPDAAGRWSLLPAREADPTLLARAAAAQLLDRHGVVTRAVAPTEGVAGRFGQVYRVLAALEESGAVRRGYFVEHLGGSQFALPGAVDQLRAAQGRRSVVLAATDPANPFGAALSWPAGTTTHRPGRTAGALVVLVDGDLAWYLERGGRTVLSFVGDRDDAAAAEHLRSGALALADLVRTGRLGRVALRRLDGAEVLDRDVLAGLAARALADAGFATTPRGLRL